MEKPEEYADTDTAGGSNADAETEQDMNSKTAELKKDFEKRLNSVLQEDDYSMETIVETIRVLCSLEKLNSKTEKKVSVPESFLKCPLSTTIMDDPVILSTGKTYDRPHIERFLKATDQKCPKTMEVVTTTHTSNNLVRDIIRHYRKKNAVKEPVGKEKAVEESDSKEIAIELPKPSVAIVPDTDHGYLNSLLEKMELASTYAGQMEAARTLQIRTQEKKSLRALFGESKDAITRLLTPLSKSNKAVPPDIKEVLIATIYIISTHDGSNELLGKDKKVIATLIKFCRFGTKEARRNAAAALNVLSSKKANATAIGKSGAFKALAIVIEEGEGIAVKNAAQAICRLCQEPLNKVNILGEGVIEAVIKKIEARILIEEMSAIFPILADDFYSTIHKMVELGVVQCLLGVLSYKKSSDRSKGNAIYALFKIAHCHDRMRKVIEEDENANGSISKLAARSSDRNMEIANNILKLINQES